MEFYTNVYRKGNKILVRGIQNGKQVKRALSYKPYVFVRGQGQADSGYKTLEGKPVGRHNCESMYDAADYIRENENTHGRTLYGLTNFVYLFIYDYFKGQIKYDPSQVSVVSLDIETDSSDGFPDIATANREITAITISRNGQKTTFSCVDFSTDDPTIKYYKCWDEAALLKSFLEVWSGSLYNPDVVTGWNIEFFDIPYLVNRIARVLGDEYVKLLSPWGIIKPYEIEIRGQKQTSYDLVGVSVMDYMALYKKFTYTNQESYKLDHIASVELGEKKVDYRDEGYTSLDDLFKRNPQRYIEYNIQDTVLVEKLEDKMKLIELVMALAYDAKINYDDTLASVNPWDIIIHNYLMDRKIVVPQKPRNVTSDPLVGGYVKEVQTGMHPWVVSFDLNSLYPHLIQQYNISPETFVEKINIPSIDQILSGAGIEDTGNAVAANGCTYRKDKQGFLGAIMAKMYDDRVAYKNEMIKVKKEYEKTKDPVLAKEIARLNNLQMAKKIQLNSAYGALGNKYFRWYDINHAEAITMSGQLSIRWIADRLNEYMNKLLKSDSVDYVVASDTDSVYLCLGPLIKATMPDETDKQKIVEYVDKICNKVLEPFIDKSYADLATRMNAYAQKMFMKREAIADKAIWIAKKRYILNVWDLEGVRYDKAKLKMSGIEAVKSSTPAFCRDGLKQSFEIIMNGSEEDLQKYITQFRARFKSMPFHSIAFPRGVSEISKWKGRGAELYKSGTPIHVKGSLLFNHLVRTKCLSNKYQTIADADKIKFCYLKFPNPHSTNVISCPDELPAEFELERYIDYDKQFEKSYLEALALILDKIDWQAEKKATLEAFF